MAAKNSVEIAPAARREIKKLTSDILERVIAAIEILQHDARPRGVEKIQGHPSFYRLATGDHRVIYHVRNSLVVILLVRDRKEAYRNIAGLDRKLSTAMQELMANEPRLIATR